jgi:hypothetical protein
VQIGMHIQIYKSSRPGIPVRTYHTSWGLVWLWKEGTFP